MANGTRSLVLSMVANVDNLSKGLNTAGGQVDGFGKKLGGFGKMAGAAFAAAGAAAVAYAGVLLVDGVKSAIADEAAQKKLAKTLENTAGATAKQIKATEDFISKQALATGVADDELRPAFERLARATGSVTESQKLLVLAQDISAGSGKSLEAVTNALGKAAEGSNTGLAKLGVGLSSAELKGMSFEEAMGALGDTFGGQAAAAADTFEGKMARMSVAFDEAKETVGGYVLDALDPLSTQLMDNVLPAVGELATGLGEDLQPVFQDVMKVVKEWLLPAIQGLWTYIQDYLLPGITSLLVPAFDGLRSAFDTIRNAVAENSDKLKPFLELMQNLAAWARDNLAPILGGILGKAFEVLGWAIGKVIEGFAWLVDWGVKVYRFYADNLPKAFTKLREIIAGVIQWLRDHFGGVFNLVSAPFRKAFELIAKLWNATIGKMSWDVPDWVPVIGGKSISAPKLPETLPMLAEGGVVTRPTVAMIGEKGPEAVVPLNRAGRFGGIHITVNGAIDAESTARQIERILKRSQLRAGAYA